MCADSRIGQNIRYFAYKCGFYIQDLIKLTCTDIINRVYDEKKACVKEENGKDNCTSKIISVCKRSIG